MSERLTDEDLDELDSWGTSPNPSTTRLVVKEIRALRARVAKLEAALRKVRLLVSDDDLRDHGFLREVNDALTDAPQ